VKPDYGDAVVQAAPRVYGDASFGRNRLLRPMDKAALIARLRQRSLLSAAPLPDVVTP
jgi:hypothetical protein